MSGRRSPATRHRAAKPAPSDRQSPFEPVLDMDEIQGIAVPGFFKPHQTLVYVHLPEKRDGIEKFRVLLREILPSVATAAETLKDRRAHRQVVASPRAAPAGQRVPGRRVADRKVLVAVAFSAQGLVKLTPGGAAIPSPAFQGGMVARAALLGDPCGREAEGHPANWVVGKPGDELDLLIVVAGDERAPVTAEAGSIMQRLTGIGVRVVSQDGDVREGAAAGHEHFGFDDGVSQPGIRGRASATPDDFITDRYIDASDIAAAWLYGYPGQDLVWPGEFVLGYPAPQRFFSRIPAAAPGCRSVLAHDARRGRSTGQAGRVSGPDRRSIGGASSRAVAEWRAIQPGTGRRQPGSRQQPARQQ